VTLNRGWSYREQVGPDGSGLSVLSYLTGKRSHSTEEEWTRRFARGEVEVEGKRVRSDAILRAGQILVWHRSPWSEAAVPTNFDVLHEDEAILAVSKPGGLPTMPAGGYLDHTLLALIRARYPEASPLHRLGRHTSGVVLFARTHDAASRLARAWREQRVKKAYRTLVSGAPRTDMFVIDSPIGPVAHPILGTVQAACEGGKPSRSVAIVREFRGDQTLLSVEIITGRPHQIRIHMACAGHPLLGDRLYEAGGGLKPDPGLPGDGGYVLHAERLEFTHPVSGQLMTMVAPAPRVLRTREELAG
jgi:23S rRNA pseudouridine1911/1915/1917 synthase